MLGVLVELYLTIDKLVFGNPIGQRPLLLLGALLIIVGVQLLSLGLIGELIANSRARRRAGPRPDRRAAPAAEGAGRTPGPAGAAGQAARAPRGRRRSRPAAVKGPQQNRRRRAWVRGGQRHRTFAAWAAAAGGPHTRSVAYFGTDQPDYPRNAVLIAGLREHGVDVREFRVPLSRG